MRRLSGQDCGEEDDAIASPDTGEDPAPEWDGGADESGTRSRVGVPDLSRCTTFDEVYRDSKDYALRYVRAQVFDIGAATDIRQRAYVTLARKMRGDSFPPNVMALLHLLLNGEIHNHFRVQGRRRTDGEPNHDVTPSSWRDPEQQLLRAEEERTVRADLHTVLGELSDYERTILDLDHGQGLSMKEIGAIVGTPPGTVAVHLSRVREKLRKKCGRFDSLKRFWRKEDG